ncbi:hypothetical protein EDF24_1444 [Curtobacterium sp. PhB130]|nr:hypothetical protein EDF24_1444 [Curtobacterium sp. PhB130]
MLLPDVAEEILEWIASASDQGWKRGVGSLRIELEHACVRLPRGMRRALTPSMRAIRSAAAKALKDTATAAEQAASHANLRGALQDALDAWRRPEVLEVAWSELLTALRDRSGDVEAADDAISGLLAALRVTGPDEPARRSKAAAIIEGSDPHRPPKDPAVPTAALSVRLTNALDVLRTVEQQANCVVWLSFSKMAVSGGAWEHGNVTMVSAEIAIATPETDGYPYPHSSELRNAIHDGFLPSAEDRAPLPFTGYVRVHLPNTRPSEAAAVARDQLTVLMQSALSGGAQRWQPGEHELVITDGVPAGSSWEAVWGDEHVDPYRLNTTGDLMRDRAPALIDGLFARPLPAQLRAALRNVEDVDRSGSPFNARVDRTIDDSRAALILRMNAVEHVAAWMRLHPETLIDILVATSAVNRTLNTAAVRARSLAHRSRDNFAAQLGREPRRTDLDLVVEQRDALLALCDGPLERARARRIFRALSSPEQLLQRAADQRATLTLIRQRHRRLRNAIVHGNPVSERALASVRRFDGTLASMAIQVALEAHLAGSDPTEALHRRAAVAQDHLDAATAGTSPAEAFKAAQ